MIILNHINQQQSGDIVSRKRNETAIRFLFVVCYISMQWLCGVLKQQVKMNTFTEQM